MPVWQPAIPQGLRPHLLSWAGYDFTSSDTDHHGVPSLGVPVVLSFAEPINCGWLHGGERHRLDVLVSGLHTTPALIQSRGRQQGLECRSTRSRPVGFLDRRPESWPARWLM